MQSSKTVYKNAILLALILCTPFLFCHAQKIEVGVQINNNPNGASQYFVQGPEGFQTGTPNYFFMDLGGFVQLNKDAYYLRFMGDVIYNSGSNEISNYSPQNGSSLRGYEFSSFAVRAGFEIGHYWDLNTRIRIQAGGQVQLGKGFGFRQFDYQSVFDTTGALTNRYDQEERYQGAFTADLAMVGRIDYRLFKQFRIGLGFRYGLATQYIHYNREINSRVFDGNGNLTNQNVRSESSEPQFIWGFTRFAAPSITLAYSFGKQ